MKSYNPFKMWGSWSGVGIFVLLILISGSFSGGNIGAPILAPSLPGLIIGVILVGIMFPGIALDYSIKGSLSDGIPIFGIISGILFSFLIGWGIHALIRKVVGRK